MPRRRALTWLVSLFAIGLFIALAFFIANTVRVEVSLSPEAATTDVALGELNCQKTFKQSFPFFEMTCAEVDEVEPTEGAP